MATESKIDYEYILKAIAEQELDSVEEIKDKLDHELQIQESLRELEKMVTEIENEKSHIFVEPLEKEKEESDEIVALGEVGAKKIKVVDKKTARQKFQNFRENIRKNKIKRDLEALENRFPLMGYDMEEVTATRQINAGNRSLVRLQKNLKEEFETDKDLYKKYKEQYEEWKNILSIYTNISVGRFSKAKENLEKVKDEKQKKGLETYLAKEEKDWEVAQAPKEEKETMEDYKYAETVEEAKSQYKVLTSHTFADIEMRASAMIKMLEIAINNGEPEEVIEYRNTRTRETLTKFLKRASPEDYKNYARAYEEVQASIKEIYQRKEKSQEKVEEKAEETKVEEKESKDPINFNVIAKKVRDALLNNANIGANVNEYYDCTKEIEALQEFVQQSVNEDYEKKEETKIHLEKFQEINNYQKELCSRITTFSNPNAVMNEMFWKTEKNNYEKLVEEINAYFIKEEINEWLQPLMEECRNQISITEENFRVFREKGGTTPSEMSDEEKGKQVRKTFDNFCNEFVENAKAGKITILTKQFENIEKMYKNFEKDTNVFSEIETFEELLYPYTHENIATVFHNMTTMDKNIKNMEIYLQALQKTKNSILTQKVEDILRSWKNFIEKSKSEDYASLFGVNIEQLEKIYINYQEKFQQICPNKEEKSEKVERVYKQVALKNSYEDILDMEKQLTTLLTKHKEGAQVEQLKNALRINYTQKYDIKEQTIKADMQSNQKLYDAAEVAYQNNSLDDLNNAVDTLLGKRAEVQEEMVTVLKEIERDKEVWKQLGLGHVLIGTIEKTLNERINQIKENAETYAVKSNALATKLEKEEAAKDKEKIKQQEIERKQREDFYEVISQFSDEELKAAGIRGTARRKEEQELQPITVSKMPESSKEDTTIKENVQSDAFNQRVSQLEGILNAASTMPIDELEEKLVTEKYLVEQNSNLFTEEQLSYLNDLTYKGEILLSEQTLKKL